ncbi:MAG: uroporphyrinogen decarboxylase family protein [Bacteroidota bacterium]
MKQEFQPDYRNLVEVLHNRRPKRLPLYEHNIDAPFIAKYLKEDVAVQGTKQEDYDAYHKKIISFWKDNTYDGFSYEAGICSIYPGHGAIFGGKQGPIQTMDDFQKYPFDDVPRIFWETYTPHFEAIRNNMLEGMKAYGGCGFGIFESSEDLVGYESLSVMQYLDPELFDLLYKRIGDLYMQLWSELIDRYDDLFAFYRIGDDMGFKTSTLLSPEAIRQYILPQYKRVIDMIHKKSGKKFLMHNCGCIFSVMDDIINCGIDAKHSNEDEIAPFEKWIDLYNDRIGLFGGIDMNILVQKPYDEVYKIVLEKGTKYRGMTKGYALGSGNSIPDYVSVEGFQAMIDAVKEIRRREQLS